MNFISKIFGDQNSKVLKSLEPVAARVNELEKEYEKLSEEALKEKTREFKERLTREPLDDILPNAFAVVREASKRTLGQRHFDVQIMGGIVLHRGEIAEMKTGEGKTLVSTLPVYLNALLGKGVHVVTVNDYLAQRDAVWMGQIYNFLGLSVGCIVHEGSYIYDPTRTLKDDERDIFGGFKIVHEFLRPATRKEAYEADITYGTNNEFGFDYLRDNMAYSKEQMSQRGHHFAIVDEIDSILIDEARTPLIISVPDEESGELYRVFAKIAPNLVENTDYKVDEKLKSVAITESGIEKVENMLGVSDIYSEKGIKYVHQLEQALRAKVLFVRDRDYIVKSGEVIIVDEFTGRLMPGRRWSEGLHQAIEAKERVSIQKESRTLATITFQNYFRLYKKLSGMTGTAQTSAEEFHKVYNLEVVRIPTNKPLSRKDLPDKVFQSETGKWKALAQEIKERYRRGQPVLVGTVSIEKNEKLSAILQREGIPHKLLNAKNHEQEGAIIAQAGKLGVVTIATNMAGRGVDIVLGGNPQNDPEQIRRVTDSGGLLVIGTERHEARRIDDQLRGRSGRQGDPGETQFFVSLEDDLMRIFGSDRIKRMMGAFGIPEEEAIENKMVSRAIESAQAKIEGFHFDSRKHILEYDDVMNKQRQAIYKKRQAILFSGEEEQKKMLSLRIIDLLWMEHIDAMEYMRSSVNLRAYGQRDPLIEYKNEGARMFKILLSHIDSEIEHLESHIKEHTGANNQKQTISNSIPIINNQLPATSNQSLATNNKLGRNDPCYCGSGKKYKRCHGV
ncbi:MAG: preprotein translocase subunit SecA [Patescibacteria group bacterium]